MYAVDARTGGKRLQKDFNTQDKDGRTRFSSPTALSHSRKIVSTSPPAPGFPGKSNSTTRSTKPLSMSILVGDTIFSGGPTKVYATRCIDGKELWSATVPAPVIDLAVNAGRPFVQSDSG